MKRAVFWIAGILLLAGGMTATWFLARPAPPVVSVRKVERQTISDTVSGIATGYVEPSRRVWVQADIPARIRAVLVKRGDPVHAGQDLVTLDGSDLADQVRTLQAAIPVLQARVRQASTRAGQLSTERDRFERLEKVGALPTQQLDNATYGRDLASLDRVAAVAALGQARVNLEVASEQLRKTVARAPMDGVVLDVPVEVGQMAGGLGGGGGETAGVRGGGIGASALLASASSAGSGGLVEIADETEMFVHVDIDEMDYWKVKIGQTAVMTIDALGKKKVTGTVAEVFPYISRALDQNRTARVKILLPEDARGEVLPGMSANVDIVVGRREAVLVMPTQCLVTRPTGKVAWKVEDGKVRETPLRVGVTTWEWTAVDSGLVEGDLVAIPPSDVRLKDGLPIEAKPE